MSDDLVAFLAARLDEDEAAAKAAPGMEWRSFSEDDIAGASVYDEQWLLLNPGRYDHDKALSSKPGATGPQYIQCHRDDLVAHIARHDPARVLREVAAKRAILALHDDLWAGAEDVAAWGMQRLLRRVAAVYSDHPGYRAEWKP